MCIRDSIKKGLAYVCELTPEQFKEYRGDVNTPARSPFRDRPIEAVSYTHLDVYKRQPQRGRQGVQQTKAILGSPCGGAVTGAARD